MVAQGAPALNGRNPAGTGRGAQVGTAGRAGVLATGRTESPRERGAMSEVHPGSSVRKKSSQKEDGRQPLSHGQGPSRSQSKRHVCSPARGRVVWG